MRARKALTAGLILVALLSGRMHALEIPEVKKTPSPIEGFAANLLRKAGEETFPMVDRVSKQGWFCLDIAGHCNRDHVSQWIGKGYTLRYLRPGKKTYYGVPFQVMDPKDNDGKSCILLRADRFPSFPERVRIEVDRKAKVLYFLHACAYAQFGDGREYVVHYDDGQSEHIVIVPAAEVASGQGENIQDWFFPPAIGGPDIKYVALPMIEEPTKVNQLKFVYLLQWLNPHSEKTIQAIELISGKGPTTLFMLGITGNGD